MALRSKHSFGMQALISPLLGNDGALGSRGLYELVQYASLDDDVDVDLLASALPPFPMVT